MTLSTNRNAIIIAMDRAEATINNSMDLDFILETEAWLERMVIATRCAQVPYDEEYEVENMLLVAYEGNIR